MYDISRLTHRVLTFDRFEFQVHWCCEFIYTTHEFEFIIIKYNLISRMKSTGDSESAEMFLFWIWRSLIPRCVLVLIPMPVTHIRRLCCLRVSMGRSWIPDMNTSEKLNEVQLDVLFLYIGQYLRLVHTNIHLLHIHLLLSRIAF